MELYKTDDGETQIEVRFNKETVWLTLNQLSELYGRDKSVISRHLNNIFKNGELNYNATVAKNATVQTEGKRRVEREIEYFNLDVIISVGYRVNSKQGTQFRIWATKRLKEYLIQGYSVNQKRLEELGRILHIIENTNQKQPEGRIDETKGYYGKISIIKGEILRKKILYNCTSSTVVRLPRNHWHGCSEIATGSPRNFTKVGITQRLPSISRKKYHRIISPGPSRV